MNSINLFRGLYVKRNIIHTTDPPDDHGVLDIMPEGIDNAIQTQKIYKAYDKECTNNEFLTDNKNHVDQV